MRGVRLELDVTITDETASDLPGERAVPVGFSYRKDLALVDDLVTLGPFVIPEIEDTVPPSSTPGNLEVDLPDLDPTRIHLLIVRHSRLVDIPQVISRVFTVVLVRREIEYETAPPEMHLAAGNSIILGGSTFGSVGEPEDSLGLHPQGFMMTSPRFANERNKVVMTTYRSGRDVEVMLHYAELQQVPEDFTETWP